MAEGGGPVSSWSTSAWSHPRSYSCSDWWSTPVVYDVALALTDAQGFDGEFDTISGGIGMAAAPLVLACAALAPAYVRGLSAAMIEGS